MRPGAPEIITLCIDQRFLSTYDLTPRLLQEEIIWDDLKQPCFDVVKNKLLSEYNFKYTEAYVKIRKDYLQDYLYLRKKTAIKIFTIKRNILIDQDIASLLNGKGYYIEEFKHFEIRIRKYDHKENTAGLEINGYKILFQQNSVDDEKHEAPLGHYWKGIEGLVTSWEAIHEMSLEYVYVSDDVLAKYEADDNYDVHPLSGSVHYRNQWAVSYCSRVGRNAIKLEIKKLYEGNRYDVIDYWNKFSIHPSEIIDGENIASKAERLAKKFFLFGQQLSSLLNKLFKLNYTALDIITLDEKHIEYTGWSDFTSYKEIACHIHLQLFSKEQFLSRCKKLYILLGENLRESTLRKIVEQIQIPEVETKKMRSLKLLELIFKYLHVAQHSGLNPVTDKTEIADRISEIKEFHLLSPLFALNDIRQLDAHKGNNAKPKLQNALKELGIEINSIANNYADACFNIYDNLITTLNNLNNILLVLTISKRPIKSLTQHSI